MHIHFAEQYHAGESLIHRLDPRTKVILTVLFILTVSLTPFGAFGSYIALFALLMATAVAAHIAPAYLLKRSVIALPFALAAVTLPFTVPGATLATIPIFGGIAISQPGTIRFISILIKSWLSVQMAIILVTVTPFPAVLWALRALHLPAPLIAIVSLMYRYLFVLYEEATRLLRARSARSAAVDGVRSGGSLLWRGQVAGRMAGSLMLRSFERSERIYNAMLARGYKGQLLSVTHSHLQTLDFLVAAVTIAALLTILLSARMW
ncbi:MAG: cobalt ECF transporter T component CbiQ [Caldilineaceae bacterium]|nr:cobalt ECF transporter T component CbiQ [Caldilineaceae bacterium]